MISFNLYELHKLYFMSVNFILLFNFYLFYFLFVEINFKNKNIIIYEEIYYSYLFKSILCIHLPNADCRQFARIFNKYKTHFTGCPQPTRFLTRGCYPKSSPLNHAQSTRSFPEWFQKPRLDSTAFDI